MARHLATWTLTALASCTCGRGPSSPPPPADPGPTLEAWAGPENPAGPGLLSGGVFQASVRLSVLPDELIPAELAAVDPDAPITMTLGRPLAHGQHHRVAWTQRAGTSWRDVLPEGERCALFNDAACVAYADWTAAVITQGPRVRVDLFPRTGFTREGAEAQLAVPPRGELGLLGHIAARTSNVRAALGDVHPPTFDSASLEFVVSAEHTALRLRWELDGPPATRHSLEPAPSWDALCSGAIACVRTGPWPDVAGWLTARQPLELPSDPAHAALAALSEWPSVIAGELASARARLPEAARGFYDASLAGLGEVAFAGGRLLEDGTALGYVRVPSAQVNFTAGLLAWAGRPSTPTTLGDGTEVSWIPLDAGGIVLALDDGESPAMGWVAYASTPDAFTWLETAPRTAAGGSAVFVHVRRLDSALNRAPGVVQQWLRTLAGRAVTARMEAEDGYLTATVQLTNAI